MEDLILSFGKNEVYLSQKYSESIIDIKFRYGKPSYSDL